MRFEFRRNRVGLAAELCGKLPKPTPRYGRAESSMPILAIDVMRAEQISRSLFALQYPHVVGFGWHPKKRLCINVLHRHPIFYSV